MDLRKIKKEFPNAYEAYEKREIKNRIYYFDSIGIRIYTKYGASGGHGVIVYRKKTKEESAGEHDWKMIRETHVHSYETRIEAEDAGMKIAFEIHEEWLSK